MARPAKQSTIVELSSHPGYLKSPSPLEVTGPDGKGTRKVGGGDGGNMEPQVSMKDYVDARDDAMESRLAAKLDGLPSRRTIWGAVSVILGGIFTALTILLGTMAFGSDRFNGGLSVSPVLAEVQERQQKTDQAQDAKLELIDRKLDILIQKSSGNDDRR